MDDSPENSPAIFIRGGEPWLMGYCWQIYFKVLEVLFLASVSHAFLPSKQACGAHPFRHFCIRQRYRGVFRDTTTGHFVLWVNYTICTWGTTGTHCHRGYPEAFEVGFLPMVYPNRICSRYVPLGSWARSAAFRSASKAAALAPKTRFAQNEVEYRLPMIVSMVQTCGTTKG